MKTVTFAIIAALSAVTLAGPGLAAPALVTPDEARQIAKEAYVYAYSPVYAYRFLQDEVFNTKSTSYIGAFNKIRNYQRLNTAEDTMFTPNVDTPYTRVWLDLSSSLKFGL